MRKMFQSSLTRLSKKPTKVRRMRLTTKTAWTGFLFTSPFVLGFLFFFLQPLIQSIRFAFSNVDVTMSGYHTTFIGLKNLHYVFRVDSVYLQNLVSTVTGMLWQIPLIIVFSLFFAVVLNKKFHGRLFARGVFFLSVIIGTGLVLNIIRHDAVGASVMAGDAINSSTGTENDFLQTMLVNSGLSKKLVSTITMISDNMLFMMWRTGIQMIIFMAGLQSIPSTLYEASSIEGATSWEAFWKITLPMLLPITKLNLVYTVVDTFTHVNNGIMIQVMNNVGLSRYGWASAMAWSYFLVVAILLVIVFIIFYKIENWVPREIRNRRGRYA